MNTEASKKFVPPFFDESVRRIPTEAERSFLSQATMLVGFSALTLAMGGGVWLILKVLENGLMDNLEMAFVGMIPIALAYLVGWIFSILSIRAYNNLVFPLIVRYYSWLTLTGALVIYIKVIQKLFIESYRFPNFLAYNFILLGILLALFGLHLLSEDHDLRPFSIPIFMVGLFHLWIMLLSYVFFPHKGQGVYVFGDLFVFAVMQTIAGLMMAHSGIFNPLRRSIADFFRDSSEVFH